MKLSATGTIISNNEAGPHWCRLEIEAPEIASSALPGQFVEVRGWEGTSPLLRRPFSVAGTDSRKGTISLLIKRRGTATRILCAAKPGSALDLIGPLGNFFTPAAPGDDIYLVAGGIGVAPLRFFVEREISKDIHPALLFGSRDSSEIKILEDPLIEHIKTAVSTEDGSSGTKGLITSVLEGWTEFETPRMILSCGPVPMMKAVARIAAARGIACEVSMETYMGCGIGACMGCVVPVKNINKPYVHACKEGPVMDARTVDWERV